MDFNSVVKLPHAIAVLLMIISCAQKPKDESFSSQEEASTSNSEDSIVFRTSGEEFVYVATRLFPAADSEVTSEVMTRELISIEEVGDKIFAFLNSQKLNNRGNPQLPFATDSLLSEYYPKYFEVEIDDDIPYIAYLRSSQDNVQFIRKRSGDFYIETAVIKDTVLNVLGKIKVGMTKTEVLSELDFPLEVFDREDFSLILCHGDVPSGIWYKGNKEFKKTLNRERPTTQIGLRFQGGLLVLAYINPWIGYGEKGEVDL